MTNTMIYFKYLFAFLFSDKFNFFIHFLNTSEHFPTWRSVCLFWKRHLNATLWFVTNDLIGPSLRPSQCTRYFLDDFDNKSYASYT